MGANHAISSRVSRGWEREMFRLFNGLMALLLAFACAAQQNEIHLKQVKGESQYKRVHQGAIFRIYDGKLDDAARVLDAYDKEKPNDVETLFMRAVIAAHQDKDSEAHEFLKQAIDAGLPVSRILADANNLLESLDVSRYLTSGEIIVHGPMASHDSPTSIRVWVRTAVPASVSVRAYDTGQIGRDFDAITADGATNAEWDNTGAFLLTGLVSDRTYRYVVRAEAGGLEATREGLIHTLPKKSEAASFTVAFGGGAGYVPQHEHMWDTIRAREPMVFFFLGDNIYPDAPALPQLQRYSYYRRQSGDAYRRFVSHTGIWAVWDDHDFSVNDSWGGPELDVPSWKKAVWDVFRQNWPNPAYGGGEGLRGCWFQTAIGDVDYFLLDSRYYRTDPKGDNPTMLGPAQRAWLLDGLKHSNAAFKVICSPVPFVKGTKGGSLDTWDGYDDERELILGTIRENKIDGVFVLSADRHRSDIWRMDEEGMYPIYELESSRLTNQHVHEEQPGSLFSYNKLQSFGLLHFDTTKDDPEVTYTIVNINGEEVHSHTIRKSEISFAP